LTWNEDWHLQACAQNSKNCKLPVFGFQSVAKYIKVSLKIYTSSLVYSQIWLNLSTDHRQFFYIFIWMIAATLAAKGNS
jgi:flagellar biosynthesis protein FliR